MNGEHNPWEADIASAIRTGQIIVEALAIGPAMFLLVLVFLPSGPPGKVGLEGMLTWIAVGYAGVALVLRFLVPTVIVVKQRRQIAEGTYGSGSVQRQGALRELLERTGDAGLLWSVYLTKTIIAGALVEGAAFFLLIAYFMEREPIALVTAVLMIALIATLLPIRSRVVAWIEDQLRQVEQERQLARTP